MNEDWHTLASLRGANVKIPDGSSTYSTIMRFLHKKIDSPQTKYTIYLDPATIMDVYYDPKMPSGKWIAVDFSGDTPEIVCDGTWTPVKETMTKPFFRYPVATAHAYHRLLTEVVDALTGLAELACVDCGASWVEHPDTPDLSALLSKIEGKTWSCTSHPSGGGEVTQNEGAMS